MQPGGERPALIIQPGISPRLRLIVLGLYGLTLPVVLLLPLAWPWRTLLVLALLIGLVGSLGGAVGHRWPWVPRQAIWHPEGHWTLTLGDGREVPARLLPTTYVTPALVVLNFRLGTGTGCEIGTEIGTGIGTGVGSRTEIGAGIVTGIGIGTRIGKGLASPSGLASWKRAVARPAAFPPGTIRSLVLLPDNLDPDLHRRLRVRLRLEGTRTAPGGEVEGGRQ